MTQEQKYENAGQIENYELRQYHSCVVAEVEVHGAFESAGNSGFRPLINYISGGNQASAKVAMTAPVIQLSLLPNEVQNSLVNTPGIGEHSISFVMPAEYTHVSQLPSPSDPRVVLREMPEHIVLVDRFTGRWSESIYAKRLAALEGVALAHGFTIAGPARFARFNPPWTPSFMRRNEIQLPVNIAKPV